jgi:two-component system, OmpR family, osmolarity sensor histidine kinase EnvZ
MIFQWLKKLMPRSLYGRAALILLLPVITLQLVISVAFIQRHFDEVTRQMTRSVLIDLNYLLDQIAAAPDDQAAAAVAETLGAALKLTVGPATTPLPQGDSHRFYDLSGSVVISTLRANLDNLQAINLDNQRRVEMWVTVPQGVMKLGFDRARVSASNPHQLLVLMLVLGILMTLIAFSFLRNQLRPIKRLATAAAAFGKGRNVPYQLAGATEVRAAGAAFLDMRARIERQTQSRTMMLSGVSHDLRTPLTRLRLGLSLIDEAEAAPLLRDVDDMQHLLDAFLDFARGDAEDALIPVDPRALVEQIVADAARAGQAAVLTPNLAGPGTALIPLRPMAVRRAVENLIGNALRYGSRAELSLTISDRMVRISVEDDGPGIPPDRREEAMRPFTRLDPARNQNLGTGVGLGLAIVADIARGHGGVLRLGESARLGGLRADLVLAR